MNALTVTETRVNDTITRTDSKQIRLRYSWNKMKLDFDRVRVAYVKVNFGVSQVWVAGQNF
jgi:hypothetical protein